MTFILDTDHVIKVLSEYCGLPYIGEDSITAEHITKAGNYIIARRIVRRHR